MNDEIMTLAEVAEFLKLSDKTILKMVKNQEIPCAKIANQWRFSKLALNDWISSKMEVIPRNDLTRLIEKEYDSVPLSRLMDEENIILPLKASNREEVIRALGNKAFESRLISDKETFVQKLLEREEITSTSIGSGMAIPHLRNASSEVVKEPKIIIAVSPDGVDFGSFDGEDTKIFFLIISDSEVVHLRLLSKLSRILKRQEAAAELQSIDSKSGFIQYFIEVEKKSLFSNGK